MSDQRTKLLKLLAVVEQQIREAETLAADESLSVKERQRAAAQLDFRRDSIKRIELMLQESSDAGRSLGRTAAVVGPSIDHAGRSA
jgi:hypothetical protein